MDQPPTRRCCCKDRDAYECARLRYGSTFDDDFEERFPEPCECSCHDEFRDWREGED